MPCIFAFRKRLVLHLCHDRSECPYIYLLPIQYRHKFSLCFIHQTAILTVCMYSLIDEVYVTVSFGFKTSSEGKKSSQSERNICQCLRTSKQNPSIFSLNNRTVSDMRVSTQSHLPSKTLDYSLRGEHTLTEDIPEQTAEQGKCIQGNGANRTIKETA